MGSWVFRSGSLLLAFLVGLAIAFFFNAMVLKMQPDYKGEIAAISSERDGANTENVKLKQRLKKLQTEVASTKELRTQRKNLVEKNEELQQRLARVRSNRDDLKSQVTKRNQRIAVLEAASAKQTEAPAVASTEELVRLKDMLQAARFQAKGLRAKRKKLNRRFVRLREGREADAKQISALKAELAGRNPLAAASTTTDEETIRLKDMLQAARFQAKSLRAKRKQLNKQIKRLRFERNEDARRVAELEAELAKRGRLAADSQDAKAEIVRLQGLLDKSQKSHAKKLNGMSTKIETLMASITHVAAARDEVQSLASMRARENSALLEQRQQTTTRFDMLRSDLERSKVEMKQLREKLALARTNRESVVTQRDKLAVRLKARNADLVRIRESRNEFKLLSEQRARESENNASKATVRISSLEAMLRKERDALGTVQRKQSQCEANIAQCQSKLASVRSGIAKQRMALANACQSELQRIAKAGRILFASGSAVLTRSSFATMDRLASQMSNCSDMSIAVEGHTDSSGPADANRILSQQRAASVQAYLVKKGVDPKRLSSIGLGSDKPVASNVTPEGRRANRRIQFVVGN